MAKESDKKPLGIVARLEGKRYFILALLTHASCWNLKLWQQTLAWHQFFLCICFWNVHAGNSSQLFAFYRTCASSVHLRFPQYSLKPPVRAPQQQASLSLNLLLAAAPQPLQHLSKANEVTSGFWSNAVNPAWTKLFLFFLICGRKINTETFLARAKFA